MDRHYDSIRTTPLTGLTGKLQLHTICCIGAGYVGGSTSAVIAYKNPTIDVHVVDSDAARIAAWRSDELPVSEAGLELIVKTCRDGVGSGRTPNLHFSTNIAGSIGKAQVILLAVNTPAAQDSFSPDMTINMDHFNSAAHSILSHSTTDKVIVVRSTVSCGTSRMLHEMFRQRSKPGVSMQVISNPEFLAVGTVVDNLLNPDRVLIGSEDNEAGRRAARLVSSIYESWVPSNRIVQLNWQSAELAKLAANAMLAQRISNVNALSAICEKTGADIDCVAFSCGLDTRIGPSMLKASLGYGGSCLAKDVRTLGNLADQLSLPLVGSYWRSIDEINEFQQLRFLNRLVTALNAKSLHDRSVAILGYAFKKGTGDIRGSPSVSLIGRLQNHQINVRTYDPKAKACDLYETLSANVELSMDKSGSPINVRVCSDVYSACENVDAIVIATEWDEFAGQPATFCSIMPDHSSEINGTQSPPGLDWARIARQMRQPRLVFDGRNILDAQQLRNLGFVVHMIGK